MSVTHENGAITRPSGSGDKGVTHETVRSFGLGGQIGAIVLSGSTPCHVLSSERILNKISAKLFLQGKKEF